MLILIVKRKILFLSFEIGICDRNVDMDEIVHALKGMANSKNPGSDGLTVEFYRAFLQQLKDN